MQSPNILYLHTHDCGRYVQPYGYSIPTPNIQKLAEEGMLFRNCYCVGPTCSPSRAGLVTGQSAHSSGMTGLAHRGWSLDDYSQHIVHTLRGAGYGSALIGFQHVARDPEVIGYDQIVSTPDGPVAAAREFFQRVPDEPFFVSVGLTTTHRGYAEPSGQGAEDPRYCRPPEPLPDTPRTRRDMAAYKASARIMDQQMGAVLDALEDAGLAGDTLVVCTTDHGIAFPRMKCNLTDGGIGVMLIMRGPAGFGGGRVTDALISQADLFPTLCDLLAIDIPSWVEGSSFMPVVNGEAEEVNEAIFSEVSYHAAYEPQRCVRTPRHKYIRRFGDRADRTTMPNCDGSPSKRLWVEHGWKDRPVAVEQLYDLLFDPNECDNLVEDGAYEEVLEQMRGRLSGWMKQTDDPLLQGKVPAPSGARVDDPEGDSPGGSTREVG
jgi:arylsulfatase A-like enzyme